MSEYWDEYTDLLGAFALDAVDDDERDRIELHLVDCPRCRAEVSEHREVAVFLSQSGADAPAGVWDKIAAELSPAAPPMRLTLSPLGGETSVDPAPSAAPAAPLADVVPMAPFRSAPGKLRTRTFVAVLSAAAVIVAVLGFVAVNKSQQLDRLETASGRTSIEGAALDALASSDVKAELTGTAGKAQAAVEQSGHGYLITKDMPAPAEGDVYQLWGIVEGNVDGVSDSTVLSLGTFGADASVVTFTVDPARLDEVTSFAVTQEKAPGVLASENNALMSGTV